MNKLDIRGNSENAISRNLSNMAVHEYLFRGFRLKSAESVLQSVKYKNPYMQLYALSLTGINAQREGRNHDWKKEQKLYWFGYEMDRDSKEYQSFIDELYICLLKNENFNKCLLESKDFMLIHSIGNQNPKDTILTEYEFCERLTAIREYIMENREYKEDKLKEYLVKLHNQYIGEYIRYKALGTFERTNTNNMLC